MFIKSDKLGNPKPEKQGNKKTFTQKNIKPLFAHVSGGSIESKIIKASDLPEKVDKALKPIKKVSDKRAVQNKEYLKIRKQFLKDNPICEFDGCRAFSEDLHHTKGRVGKLLTDEKYFMAFCREHHSFVELNPKFAKENGYSLSRLSNE